LPIVKKTVVGAVAALSVMMTMFGCGDGIGGVTTGSSPSGTPKPSATPAPGTGTSASPTPTPSPTPRPGALSCTLPSLPICDAACCTAGGTKLFTQEIQAAEDDLYATQPGLFLPNGDVKNNLDFLAALAKRLTEMTGLCAQANGHDEIRVKRDQSVSQHVDVLLGADATPWVGGVYTCRPASF
jgi:hypothetical protein